MPKCTQKCQQNFFFGLWMANYKKCKQILENAQRRATRLVPELHGMSYRERLMELNLSTLEYRRKRYDIIQVFKGPRTVS